MSEDFEEVCTVYFSDPSTVEAYVQTSVAEAVQIERAACLDIVNQARLRTSSWQAACCLAEVASEIRRRWEEQ